ncbi:MULTISPECIES: helix-turn-helix domain-containing protein [Streptococcus]|uniref:Helix-turn-helix domain-containing protein n=1 Tax=Streptococcus caledonicus TaxID=2614158 RepID=A0ABW0UBW4_9STRE|nr:helix-turn-helix domain-containing protein [Streptococcus sp. S784/96/1]
MNGKMIGDILREARLAKQFQLTDIEHQTGIASHHLLALELDQFGLIPTDQVELYLSSYAESVDLEASEILIQYREQNLFQNTLSQMRENESVSKLTSTDEENIPMERMAHRRRRSHREKTQKKSILPKVIISFLSLAIVALAGYFVIKQLPWPFTNATTEITETSETVTETEITTSIETTTSTITELPSTIKAVAQEDGNSVVAFQTDKEVVDVTFTLKDGESWVSLNDTLNGERATTLTQEQKEFTVSVNKGSLSHVTIGIPQAAQITVDGQKIDLSSLVNSSPAIFTLMVE